MFGPHEGGSHSTSPFFWPRSQRRTRVHRGVQIPSVNDIWFESSNQPRQSEKGKWIDRAAPAECRDRNSGSFAGRALLRTDAKRQGILDRVERCDLHLNTVA